MATEKTLAACMAIVAVVATLGLAWTGLTASTAEPTENPATPAMSPDPPMAWSVYIHAHPDDWQLFMSPGPYFDYQSGRSLLFIYATAGDAGVEAYWWTAREQGAQAAVRALVGTGPTESSAMVRFCHTQVTPVCHDIRQITYGRTISLYMRLPDGNYGGYGFPETGNVSLQRLRDGIVANLTAVDGSARYDGWPDFYLTLRSIVLAYTPYDVTTHVVTSDFDRARQETLSDRCFHCPNHADHLAVADAVHAFAVDMEAPWRRSLVIDYPIMYEDSRYPVNLGNETYAVKKQIFLAYSDKVKELTELDEYESGKDVWEPAFRRSYVRDLPDNPPPSPGTSHSWDVYVSAGPGTWQLFESPSASEDYRAGHNLLLIYTTAGDAGAPSWWWQAREEGAKASTRWMVGGAAENSGPVRICYGSPVEVCHDISSWTYGRTVSFFLRLPDGNYGGLGFQSTGFASMARLRDGFVPSLRAVDNSTTYTGWADLTSTMGAIVRGFAPYNASTWIQGHDFDRVRQTTQGGICPGCPDHADDLATADATNAFASGTPWSRRLFVDFPMGFGDARYPANLNASDYTLKKGIYMAYNERVKLLTGLDEYAGAPDLWESLFQRLYSRTIAGEPLPPPIGSPTMWDAYVGASASSWQLFMAPSAYDDVRAGHGLVFVYTTAGDAGAEAYWWRAREEGAKASVRWMVGSASESSGFTRICHGSPADICHDVWQWSYGNTHSFFMRLPDGNYYGAGFPATGNTSLSKLRDGAVANLTAVDGSATYEGWSDFYLTIRAIVLAYAPDDSTTRIVAPDFDRGLQTVQDGACAGCPGHADDLATADAVYAIAIGLGAPWRRSLVIDSPLLYLDSRYPANLNSSAYDIKRRLFMAYSDQVKALTGLDEYAGAGALWENAFLRYYERSP